MLALKGIAHRVVDLPLAATARLRRLNAAGKVPVLDDGGRLIADSSAIVRHPEAVRPQPALLPEDPRERALVHVLEDWADESLYFYEMFLRFGLPDNARVWARRLTRQDPALVRVLARWAVPAAVRRQARAQGVGRKSVATVLADVAAQVQAVEELIGAHGWLVGRALTLADIAVCVQLACFDSVPQGRAIIDRHGRVRHWMDRVDAATRSRTPEQELAA